jgi:hypothetical protein
MTVNRGGSLPKSRIYPDDLKEFPIKNISLAKQKPFIERVNSLIEYNWELNQLNTLKHKIKFNYSETNSFIIYLLVQSGPITFE